MNYETALITGASSGIGLELAHEFGRYGHPLVLTARESGPLLSLAAEIEATCGVKVSTIARDLEEAGATEDIAAELAAHGLRVDILVNNAGLGFRGSFAEMPLENDLSMLRVNIGASLRLTKLFLPEMLRQRRGRILFTASTAGFEPGPTLAVYHATKAFILSLSEALATEVEGSGVTVTALCPGPTDTGFFLKAGMVDTRAFQESKMMSPREVAEIGYKSLMRGERVVVTGVTNKLMVFSRHLMPESAQARRNERLYQKVPAGNRRRTPGQIRNQEFRRARGTGAIVKLP